MTTPKEGGTVVRKIQLLTATALVAFACVGPTLAADPMVRSAAMYPTKNIIQNAVNSKDRTPYSTRSALRSTSDWCKV